VLLLHQESEIASGLSRVYQDVQVETGVMALVAAVVAVILELEYMGVF
jgi:hypothetical protein